MVRQTTVLQRRSTIWCMRSIEMNVFHEAWALLPAVASLAGGADVRLLLIRSADGVLRALFPMQLASHEQLSQIRILRSWRHDYCFLCTPLIDRDQISECAEAMGRWLESAQAPASIIEFHSYGADGSFARSFLPMLQRRPGWVIDAKDSARALLDRHNASDVGLSSKHQKDVRRLERRLAEHGELVYRVMHQDEDCVPWLERFMALEAAGWKGGGGTAMASKAPDQAYFRTVAMEAHRRGRLQLLALELAGVAIAMKCNYLAPPGSFAFKIAHDEQYHKFSPGLLLEMFNMRHMLGECPQLDWMDSCADAGSPMIERLWTGRRKIGWARLSGKGLVPRVLVSGAPRYRRIRGKVDALLSNVGRGGQS